MQTGEYFPFVDGLRAISIAVVVGYHIGLPGFSGGFVGVDSFFVISGFLIINKIIEDLNDHKFSFHEFWTRRVLRIGPPYLLVIVCSAIVAPFVLVLPDEFSSFGQQVLYSSLLVVNHYFLLQQGYFDTVAEAKPLLHLWSLAVEEQFYLVVPILLWAMWVQMGRRMFVIATVTVTIFVASFVGCILLTQTESGRNYAFFLMPLRAWEFIAGGIIPLFVPLLRRLPSLATHTLGLVGLAALLGSSYLFSIQTPFPYYWAAIPVFGAFAIILAGITGPNFVRSLLSLPPMVGLGLVSYSWYLWHWPLLSFSRIYNFGEQSLSMNILMGGVVALLLSVVTYFLVERPIGVVRRERNLHVARFPLVAGIAGCLIVAAAGAGYWTGASAMASIPDNMKVASFGASKCRPGINSIAECKRIVGERPLGLLHGDSHAAAAYRSFAAFTKSRGAYLALIASGGCSPLRNWLSVGPGYSKWAGYNACERYKDTSFAALPDLGPEFALVVGRWWAYLRTIDVLESKEEDVFFRAARNLINDLKKTGVKRILVVGLTPEFERAPQDCLLRAMKRGLNKDFCGSALHFRPRNREEYMARLAKAFGGIEEVRFIDPAKAFCEGELCRPFEGNTLLMIDENHVLKAGFDKVIKAYQADFDWLVGVSSVAGDQNGQ